MHILSSPDFFFTNKTGEPNGELLGLINLLSNNICNCFLSSSCSANDNLYGALLGGLTPSSNLISCSTNLFWATLLVILLEIYTYTFQLSDQASYLLLKYLLILNPCC